MRQQHVDTPVGQAAITWFEADAPPRAIVMLGHGSATGVEAPDLQATTNRSRPVCPPLLIVQGGADPYGRPDQFPSLPPTAMLVEVPLANHMFGVPARTGSTASPALTQVTDAVTTWIHALLG
jgi:predicted alpha/beta-hydrolase family hydrolase